MSRLVSPLLAAFLLATAACSAEGAEPSSASTEQQELKKAKNGQATGDGVVCTWEGIAIPGVVGVAQSTPGSTPSSGDGDKPDFGAPPPDEPTSVPPTDPMPMPTPPVDPMPTPPNDAIGFESPLPGPYKLHERFPSLDGCNECECTDRGIMCTMRACAAPTPTPKPGPEPIPPPVNCQADARICADGSAVGRTGPNCEFAPCPTK